MSDSRPFAPVSHANEAEHRRQLANSINLINQSTPDYRRTDSEISAGVTPVDYRYPEGDVRRYGAVGDGTTDDAESVQTACDVAEVNGGAVAVPPGKYRLTSTVTIPAYVRLVGAGRANATSTPYATRFQIAHTGRAFVLGGHWSRIEQCTIYYTATAASDEAIYAEDVASPSISNVYIVAPYNGVRFLACNTPVAEHVTVVNARGAYAYKVEGDATLGNSDSHLFIDISSGFTTTAPSGFKHWVAGNYANSGKVIGYRFVRGDYGVVCEGTTDDPDDMWFSSGGCDNQGQNAYRFTSGQNIYLTDAWAGQAGENGIVIGSNFTGNFQAVNLRIRGSARHGLRIDGGRNIAITNPSIGQNGRETNNTYSGISVGGAVTRLSIIGGTCGALAGGGTNQQKDGIDLANASVDYVSILGVNLEGNVTRGFTTSASTRNMHVRDCPGIKLLDGYFYKTISGAVSDGTYDVGVLPIGKILITDISAKLSSGTCDVRVYIDGIAAGGADVAVTSTVGNTALASAVEVDATSAPRVIQVNVNDGSSPEDLVVSFGYVSLPANA